MMGRFGRQTKRVRDAISKGHVVVGHNDLVLCGRPCPGCPHGGWCHRPLSEHRGSPSRGRHYHNPTDQDPHAEWVTHEWYGPPAEQTGESSEWGRALVEPILYPNENERR